MVTAKLSVLNTVLLLAETGKEKGKISGLLSFWKESIIYSGSNNALHGDGLLQKHLE